MIQDLVDTIIFAGDENNSTAKLLVDIGLSAVVTNYKSTEYCDELMKNPHSEIFDSSTAEIETWSFHRGAIKKAFDSGSSSALIVDSRISFTSDIELIKNTFKSIPRWYDFVKLDSMEDIITDSSLIASMDKLIYSSGLYLIRRNAMGSILQDMTPKVPFSDPGRVMLPVVYMFCPWRFTARGLFNLFFNTRRILN